MIFTTDKNRPVIINPERVIGVAPAYDERDIPIIGQTHLLMQINPPATITVRGDFRAVAFALGLDPRPFEEETPDDDIPFGDAPTTQGG